MTSAQAPALAGGGRLDLPPRSLHFTRGGSVGTLIEYDAGRLHLRSTGGLGPRQGQVLEEAWFRPTAADWTALQGRWSDAGLWAWPTEFTSEKSAQMDGVGWSLSITGMDGREFKSGGYNAEPPGLVTVLDALRTSLCQHPVDGGAAAEPGAPPR